MRVREATMKDVAAIVKYLKWLHETEADDRVAPFCEQTTRKYVQVAVNNRRMYRTWIVVDDEVHGILIGITNPIWYSRKKEALDLIFHVSEKGKGYGALLAKKYLRWAQLEPGVAEIYLSETHGHSERTGRMYERMGLQHSGHIYRMRMPAIEEKAA